MSVESQKKTFEIEITMTGRLAVDPGVLDPILKKYFERMTPEGRERWVSGGFGEKFQRAVLKAMLSDVELLSGFLLSQARNGAEEMLADEDHEMVGEIAEDDLYDRLIELLPPRDSEVLRKIIKEDNVDGDLPVFWYHDVSCENDQWGCFSTEKKVGITQVRITEVPEE